MKTVLIVLGALIVLKLFSHLLNRLTNPVVRSAGSIAGKLRVMRFVAKKLPEGQLLNISDLSVKELGEAMLLDGATTQEVNLAMIEALTEKHASKPTLLSTYPATTRSVPGYKSSI